MLNQVQHDVVSFCLQQSYYQTTPSYKKLNWLYLQCEETRYLVSLYVVVNEINETFL